MAALDKANVFEFKSPTFKISKDYQFTPLTVIFTVKQEDIWRKARMIAGGHAVDSSMYKSYSSVF